MGDSHTTIPIGADHAGYALKERLKVELERRGLEPLDVGTFNHDSTDYPDYAHEVAGYVAEGRAERGVLVCGTGVGMAMAANRHTGVRAAVAWTPEIAELTRRHNKANVLTLPARHLDEEEAVTILRRWLDTPFEGGRHEHRVAKIEEGQS